MELAPDEARAALDAVFPVRRDGEIDAEANRVRACAMTGNAERIALCRPGSRVFVVLRCLSEPIAPVPIARTSARVALGGRLSAAGLLDDAAVVACMA